MAVLSGGGQMPPTSAARGVAGAVIELPISRSSCFEESDESLMRQIRDGHRGAFRVLLERYWASLVAYATGIVGFPDAGEDVVQVAFIRVWQARSDWSPSGTVSGYL